MLLLVAFLDPAYCDLAVCGIPSDLSNLNES